MATTASISCQSNGYHHGWKISILYYQNEKIINPCHIKSVFGLLVNKNPGIKIYFSESNNEDLRKLREHYYQNYPNQMINTIKDSDIVFILDFQLLGKIETKILKSSNLLNIFNHFRH